MQLCVRGRPEGRNIFGRHDRRRLHSVTEAAGARFEYDQIALADVLEDAKMRVAVPCDDTIARSTRHRRSHQVAGPAAQITRIVAFHDVQVRIQARDHESREGFTPDRKWNS